MRAHAWLGRTGGSFALSLMVLAGAGTGCNDIESDSEVGEARDELPSQEQLRIEDGPYVGDNWDDTVKRYDPATRTYVRFASPKPGCPPPRAGENAPSGCLDGPRGMFFAKDKLYVVSQRPSPDVGNSEVLRYDPNTGDFSDVLVRLTNPNAPFDGRPMVLGPHNILYVADYRDDDVSPAGRIERYDASTGRFLGDLDPTGFTGNFRPTGLVFGCDGLLYVTTTNLLGPINPSPLGGDVLRFDPATGKFKDIFVEADPTKDFHHYEVVGRLNRPVGLVFGPDGNLYVISYLNTAQPLSYPNNTDRIIVYDGHTGALRDIIHLNKRDRPRAPAQSLIFGPEGQLFVPVWVDNPDPTPDLDEVRVYNVQNPSHPFTFLGARDPSSGLTIPRYIVFRRSDPATLAYGTHCLGG